MIYFQLFYYLQLLFMIYFQLLFEDNLSSCSFSESSLILIMSAANFFIQADFCTHDLRGLSGDGVGGDAARGDVFLRGHTYKFNTT